jgi:hypothetical protein
MYSVPELWGIAQADTALEFGPTWSRCDSGIKKTFRPNINLGREQAEWVQNYSKDFGGTKITLYEAMQPL